MHHTIVLMFLDPLRSTAALYSSIEIKIVLFVFLIQRVMLQYFSKL